MPYRFDLRSPRGASPAGDSQLTNHDAAASSQEHDCVRAVSALVLASRPDRAIPHCELRDGPGNTGRRRVADSDREFMVSALVGPHRPDAEPARSLLEHAARVSPGDFGGREYDG